MYTGSGTGWVGPQLLQKMKERVATSLLVHVDVTNLMEIAESDWWDWGLGKVQLAGQGDSIIVVIYLVGSLFVTIIRAIFDNMKYKLPVGATLWINLHLKDELRNELYDRRRWTNTEVPLQVEP